MDNLIDDEMRQAILSCPMYSPEEQQIVDEIHQECAQKLMDAQNEYACRINEIEMEYAQKEYEVFIRRFQKPDEK